MPESTQHKLDRVRPPRVQITYDVEIGDAIVMKELPFVVGIMADLSGDNKPAKPLKERKYTEIDRDNFNDIMYSIEPKLTLSVTNRLKKKDDDPESLVPSLTFKNLDDFSPINVLKQVPQLNELFEARTRLSDLATKLDGNDKLEEAINNALFIGVGDPGKTLDEAIRNASATSTPPPAVETGVEATTPEAKVVAKAQESAEAATKAATEAAKAKPKDAAAAWAEVARLAGVAKGDADKAAQAVNASEKAKAEASAALWKTSSDKAIAAQAAIDAAKGADATQELKDAAKTAIEEATKAANEATAAAAAPKTDASASVAAPNAADNAKPLTAKQKREALQKLLKDRKDATELTEAKTYSTELKALEKEVADAEKALKTLRETAKRKARLEGRELPEDGGSDDE